MTFRLKILLAIWGVVFGLLIVLYIVLNSWIRNQIRERYSEDLLRSSAIIQQLHALQDEQNIKSAQVVAESPRLKAVVELGDANTALQLAQELTSEMRVDMFAITDAEHRKLVQLVGGQTYEPQLDFSSFIDSTTWKTPRAFIWNRENIVYRCVTVPLRVGTDYIGILTIGYQITNENLRSVRSMTNSEVLLTIDGISVGSTLPIDQFSALAKWMKPATIEQLKTIASTKDNVFLIPTSLDIYIALYCLLDSQSTNDKPTHSYLLLKPIEKEVQASLKPVMNTFIVLSLIVLGITAIIGYVISRSLTKPIASLVEGATEISRGNYDYKLTVRSRGEFGVLAEQFQRMSESLKEKISQLALQNTELEKALVQLHEAQDELVKSERLAASGKITAQLSHELNNPIHNIQSCLQSALKRASQGAAERELIEIALEEVQRLAKLTRQTLDVYRVSMVQETKEPTDLNAVIREVVESSAPIFEEHNIRVILNLFNAMPKVSGLHDKLKQVFLNLCINAKDAMPSGGELTIKTLQQDGLAIAVVSDTGIGIPGENINRIYDAFFTTKGKVSGVGLGLSVTYGIIQQHNGTIDVKSTVGEGTTFTLTFPLPGEPHD